MPSTCRVRLQLVRLAACGLSWCSLSCGSDPGKGADSARDGRPADTRDTAVDTCAPLAKIDLRGCLEVQESDPEGDGRWPEVTRIQYDASGRELSRDLRGGEAPDTEVICRTSWEGDRLTEERCAGASLYRYTYEYDTDGHLVGQIYDASDDGSVDRRWTYVTDSDGQVIEASSDDDDDGIADAMQTFSWDSAGRMTEETWDYTLDGSIDYRRTLVWADSSSGPGTVSEDGLLMDELEDMDGDGTNDRHTTWTYDELDRPELQQRFDNGASTPTETVVWTYAGCMLDVVTTTDAGGSRTDVAWVFDDRGRPSYRIEDWNGDGAPDRLWATTWTCPGE